MPISRHVLLAGLLSASGAYFLPRHSVRAASPLRVGDQKGGAHALLTASGLTTGIVVPLQWSLFAGAPMLIQALTADAVDVGVIGDAPLVFAQAGASPIKAVAAIQTDGTMTAVIVRKDSPIRSVKDLKGRSVATLKSQTGHYLMLPLCVRPACATTMSVLSSFRLPLQEWPYRLAASTRGRPGGPTSPKLKSMTAPGKSSMAGI